MYQILIFKYLTISYVNKAESLKNILGTLDSLLKVKGNKRTSNGSALISQGLLLSYKEKGPPSPPCHFPGRGPLS